MAHRGTLSNEEAWWDLLEFIIDYSKSKVNDIQQF
jgi:hypothetical protein